MENRLITLAIHTEGKASILKHLLENNGIEVFLEKVNNTQADSNIDGFRIRIHEKDIQKALATIEANNLFNYSDEQTYTVDDGRKRILVAVDFSEYSLNACRAAFHIAKKMNAKVKILHVYYNIYYPLTFPFADQLKDKNDVGLLDRVRKQMLDLCCEIDQNIRDEELPSVNYSYSIREGIVEEEIEQFAKEYKPFLLVLGTKGKDHNGRLLLGNVTADIIEMTNIPVLAVPEQIRVEKGTEAKHIMFLTNLNERDLASFDTLVQILKPIKGVRISLVHLNLINKRGDKWGKPQLEKMREYFLNRYPDLNISYKLIDTPDIVEAIIDFVEDEKVSVLALNTRKRGLFGRMFVPSVSRKMLDKSKKAALLVLRG